jgi:purine-binding chemotaxis protein CheW
MASKKKRKKAARGAAENASASPRIILPAFGLAEEILATQADQRSSEPGTDGQTAYQENEKSGVFSHKPSDLDLKTQEAGPLLHLVTFNLEKEEYGVDIGNVQEIIRVGQITAVPNAPTFVKGVINLRGRIIPVLSLRRRLGLPEEVLTKNSRIMVVEAGAKVLGMLVDAVSQVIRIPVASVDTPPGEVEGTNAFVKGIGKVDSRLIMIMELDKVLLKETPQAVG